MASTTTTSTIIEREIEVIMRALRELKNEESFLRGVLEKLKNNEPVTEEEAERLRMIAKVLSGLLSLAPGLFEAIKYFSSPALADILLFIEHNIEEARSSKNAGYLAHLLRKKEMTVRHLTLLLEVLREM